MSVVAEPKDNQDNTMDLSTAEAAPAGQKQGMKWYVVQVYSGFEQKVKLSLVRAHSAGRHGR